MDEFFTSVRDCENAVFADEVGLAYAVENGTHLSTSFQPIFRAQGQELLPFAVEARLAPRRGGTQIPAGDYLASLNADDAGRIDAICRTLHIRNHANLGVGDPLAWSLYFTEGAAGAPARSASADAAFFAETARLAGEAGLAGTQVICELAGAAEMDVERLGSLALAARQSGIRIAIAAFRADRDAIEQVSRIEPDVIKIDGAWFRAVHDRTETASLFPAVMTAYKGTGATLLVQGIETGAELAAALDAGADWLQGNFLAEALPAGCAVEEIALSTGRLVPDDIRQAHARG